MRTNWILLLSLIKWNWICWFQSIFWISFNAQVIFQAHHANLLVKWAMIDIFSLIPIWRFFPLFWKYFFGPNLELLIEAAWKSGPVPAGYMQGHLLLYFFIAHFKHSLLLKHCTIGMGILLIKAFDFWGSPYRWPNAIDTFSSFQPKGFFIFCFKAMSSSL